MKRQRIESSESEWKSDGPDVLNAKSSRLVEDIQTKSDAGTSPDTNLNSSLESDIEMQRFEKEEDDNNLILRGYQKELAQKALNGQNALIVAPTGSGKTPVLTEIIKQHIESTEQKNRRVLFFVPKTTLAQQQFKFLKRYLSCSVSYIIGELTALAPPGLKIKNSQVTVLTPQVFLNELKSSKEKRYVDFSDISMIIFDECHNATKNHPYKEIMDMFLDEQDQKHNVQIVGVTASPGVGKAKNKERVKENLLRLLANLNITTAPCTVEKNLKELEEHQNKIRESLIQVKTETEFESKVLLTMSDIEQNVKKLNTENEAKQLSNIPSEKAKQVYMNWTDQLKQHGKLYMSDQDAARKLITYSKHLRMYHWLLDLKNLIPQAMLKTNKMVDFVHEGSENIELEEKNEELLKMSSNIELPMLGRLVNILGDEFKKNPEARCIIFVKMRLTASCLEEYFMNNNELKHLNPKYLTGTHANVQSEAMTKDSQESVLKSFREGVTKVLIATSVAEEGLDIPACNLVIMFNYVTGEVGRIQRKGRGRAVDSRAIVITSQESDHLRKEEDNKICSQASDIAIQDVKNMTEEKLKMQITEIQKKQKEDRDIKRKMANNSSKTKESPSKWKVLCGDCGFFITSADKLRHIDNTHTVVMDEKFHGRMKKQAMDMKKGPTIRGKGNFLCYNPKCGIKIALNLVHKKTLFPTLSIKKIKLQRDDGKVEIPGKRSNLPFAINKSVHEADDGEMQKSFDDNPEDGDEEMLDEDSLLYDEDDTYELLELI